jgi:hypothetical protein
VDRKVSLAVAIQVQRTQSDATGHWLFEDASVDGCAFVNRKTRPRDIQRNQFHYSPLTACITHCNSAAGLNLDVPLFEKDAKVRLPKSSALL